MRRVALLVLSLLALGHGGCSADTTTNIFHDAGSCNVAFCPVMGTGAACCVQGACGLDFGNGCVATAPDGGR